MALAHTLGFPRIGRDRELKKAQEAFWKGELDEAGLRPAAARRPLAGTEGRRHPVAAGRRFRLV